LVIAPFSSAVHEAFLRKPDTGLVGSKNGAVAGYASGDNIMDNEVSPFVAALQNVPEFDASSFSLDESLGIEIPGYGIATAQQLRAFQSIRPHIKEAIANGYYWPEHCAGGAYAISSEMLRRMSARTYLRDPTLWSEFPFPEDFMIGMYARAVGMEVSDLSSTGEPFAVTWRGLAFSPRILSALGYSIIHSVKNDANYSESEIRRFFSERRTGIAGQLNPTQEGRLGAHC